jgi:hypothetical protein
MIRERGRGSGGRGGSGVAKHNRGGIKPGPHGDGDNVSGTSTQLRINEALELPISSISRRRTGDKRKESKRKTVRNGHLSSTIGGEIELHLWQLCERSEMLFTSGVVENIVKRLKNKEELAAVGHGGIGLNSNNDVPAKA